MWAQRSSKTDPERNYIYLTISVPDVSPKDMKLDLTPTNLTFTGYSDTKKATYHVELEFYEEIDKENSKTHHTGRDIEMVLRKKELKEEYWPRLLKENKKVHFLKTDFDKVRGTARRRALGCESGKDVDGSYSGSIKMSKTKHLTMIT